MVNLLSFIPENRVPKNTRAASRFYRGLFGLFTEGLVDLYIQGVDVRYGRPLPELEETEYGEADPKLTTVRVILLVNLADLIARAKCCGFKCGGRSACSRCCIWGTKLSEQEEKGAQESKGADEDEEKKESSDDETLSSDEEEKEEAAGMFAEDENRGEGATNDVSHAPPESACYFPGFFQEYWTPHPPKDCRYYEAAYAQLDAATSDAAREKISYRTGVRYRSRSIRFTLVTASILSPILQQIACIF